MQLNASARRASANLDDLGGELDADGLRGKDAPGVVDEAVEEAGLSGAGGAEENDFGEVIVGGGEFDVEGGV